MECVQVSTSPFAVTKIIGRSIFEPMSACCNSSPLIPGKTTSSNKHPGISGSCCSRKHSADRKERTIQSLDTDRSDWVTQFSPAGATTNIVGLELFTPIFLPQLDGINFKTPY